MSAVPQLPRRTTMAVGDLDSMLLTSSLVETPALKEWILPQTWVIFPSQFLRSDVGDSFMESEPQKKPQTSRLLAESGHVFTHSLCCQAWTLSVLCCYYILACHHLIDAHLIKIASLP